MLVYHKHRGAGVISQICRSLQEKNPDTTSIFVEFERGEPEEITANLLTYPGVYEILELWMEASIFLNGELEEQIPALKKARTLTGVYLNETYKT